jgi:hypothetical protein
MRRPGVAFRALQRLILACQQPPHPHAKPHRLKSGPIAPCLPRTTKEPPSGPGWVHEIKQSNCTRLQSCRNDPLLSARDHRRRRCTDVINSTCALVIVLALGLLLGLHANAQPHKAPSPDGYAKGSGLCIQRPRWQRRMLSAIKARVAACLSATRRPQQCQTVPPGLTSAGGKTRKWIRSIDRIPLRAINYHCR